MLTDKPGAALWAPTPTDTAERDYTMNTIQKLQGLHHQSTTKRSHFYVGSVALDAATEIMRLEDELKGVRADREEWKAEAQLMRQQFEELGKRANEVSADQNSKITRKDKALREVLKDYERFGSSEANISDGEYTQDYTTRSERVKWALE